MGTSERLLTEPSETATQKCHDCFCYLLYKSSSFPKNDCNFVTKTSGLVAVYERHGSFALVFHEWYSPGSVSATPRIKSLSHPVKGLQVESMKYFPTAYYNTICLMLQWVLKWSIKLLQSFTYFNSRLIHHWTAIDIHYESVFSKRHIKTWLIVTTCSISLCLSFQHSAVFLTSLTYFLLSDQTHMQRSDRFRREWLELSHVTWAANEMSEFALSLEHNCSHLDGAADPHRRIWLWWRGMLIFTEVLK